MGILRYVLASLVLASHLGHNILGFNPGVMAVVVFYLLAGNVVARLWRRCRGYPGAIVRFYSDRLWRILPLYITVMCASAAVWISGAQSPFLIGDPGLRDWLFNLALIPLAYYMYNGADAFTLVPPAWSLAVEVQYYFLAPILLAISWRWFLVIMLMSLCLYGLAQVGWLNTDHFGYRLLPGVLFIFMLGAMLGDESRAGWVKGLWWCIVVYLFALGLWLPVVPYRLEVALGLAVGIPVLAWVGRQRGSERGSQLWGYLDSRLANLSYGVFLWHFPVIWALGVAPPDLGWSTLVLVLAVSTMLAALAYFLVERPLWRRYRRNFGGL